MRTKLYQGEDLLYETRKHWLVLTKPAVLIVASAFLTGAVYYYKYEAGVGFQKFIPLLSQLGQIGIIATIGLALYFIYAFYYWQFDIWVVTNRRVIDEYGIFSHNVKETPLDKIVNVSVRQGPLGLLFGFGDITIQSAAEEKGTTVFTFVVYPKKLHEAVIAGQETLRASSYIGRASDDSETKECPHCAEIIKSKAKICKYCGREQDLPITAANMAGSQQKNKTAGLAPTGFRVPDGFPKLPEKV